MTLKQHRFIQWLIIFFLLAGTGVYFYYQTKAAVVLKQTGVTTFQENQSDLLTNGLVDEVRVYNRALSVSEITALYNAGR